MTDSGQEVVKPKGGGGEGDSGQNVDTGCGEGAVSGGTSPLRHSGWPRESPGKPGSEAHWEERVGWGERPL